MRIKELTLGLLSLLLVGPALADGPAGTWIWEHPDREGQNTVTDFIDIVDDNGKLSGEYRSEQGSLEIQNIKSDGDKLSFAIDFGDKLSFTGKVSGDTYSGTASLTGIGDFPFAAKRKSKPVDPTGTWRWEYQDPDSGEQVKASAEIVNKDGAVSGTFGAPTGELPLAVAKVDGKTLTFGIDFGGTKITWSGDIDGDTMEGTIEGDFGEFPWSAKRDPKQAAGDEGDTWNLAINMPDGSVINPTLKLTMGADGILATYSVDGQDFEAENFTAGGDGSFSFKLNMPSMGIVAEFSGTQDEITAKGKISYEANGETGETTFTAKKAE